MDRLLNKDQLREAIKLLQDYIDNVAEEIEKIKRSRDECRENMQHDTYSWQVMNELHDNILLLESTVNDAGKLRNDMQKIYDNIE